jgi:hypothetical protein
MPVFQVHLDATQTRFDAIQTRFDAIQTRFDAIQTRFDAIQTRFDAIDTGFKTIEACFNSSEPFIYVASKGLHVSGQDVQPGVGGPHFAGEHIHPAIERAVTLGDGGDVVADLLQQDRFLAAHDFMLAEASPTVNRLSRMMTRYRQGRSKVACFFR